MKNIELINTYPFYSVRFIKKFINLSRIGFRKSLGQNFIVDKNIILKYIKIFKYFENSNVVEIGGGSGNLTLPLSLLMNKIVVFEVDNFYFNYLKWLFMNDGNIFFDKEDDPAIVELFKYRSLIRNYFKNPGSNVKFKILKEDFLKSRKEEILNFFKPLDKQIIFVGNIPYNISSLIIKKLVAFNDIAKEFYLTVQKEFFERLEFKGEKSFITIFTNFYFKIEKIFNIQRGSFYPSPSVDSVFFRLIPVKRNVKDVDSFFKFVDRLFNAKRKKIKNQIFLFLEKDLNIDNSQLKEKKEIFIKNNFDLINKRVEALSLDNLIDLFNRILYFFK